MRCSLQEFVALVFRLRFNRQQKNVRKMVQLQVSYSKVHLQLLRAEATVQTQGRFNRKVKKEYDFKSFEWFDFMVGLTACHVLTRGFESPNRSQGTIL